MATITQRLAQIRSDYAYIVTSYGDVNDFTGSGMEDMQLTALLLNPSKQTAFDCYKERLQTLFEDGYCTDEDGMNDQTQMLPILEDDKLRVIGRRYSLFINDDIYVT